MKTKRLLAFCLASLSAVAAGAGEVLFPQPLHLVRRVTDAIAGTDVRVDEYCAGNRIVSASGQRVSILDLAEERLIEIDRRAGTYSVTSLTDLSRANATLAAARPQGAASSWKPRESEWSDARQAVGRRAEARRSTFEASSGAILEVTVDPSVLLSRAALEVLIGASHPAARSPEHDAVLLAATPAREGRAETSAAPPASYALPRSQTLAVEGEIVIRNLVERVDAAVVPQHLVTIDPSLRRIECATLRLAREHEAFDRLPGQR